MNMCHLFVYYVYSNMQTGQPPAAAAAAHRLLAQGPLSTIIIIAHNMDFTSALTISRLCRTYASRLLLVCCSYPCLAGSNWHSRKYGSDL